MGQQGKHLNSVKVSHEKHTAGCATEKMAIPALHARIRSIVDTGTALEIIIGSISSEVDI